MASRGDKQVAPVTSVDRRGPPWAASRPPWVLPLVGEQEQPLGSQQTLDSGVRARGFAAKEAPGSRPEVLAWMSHPQRPQTLQCWWANADYLAPS